MAALDAHGGRRNAGKPGTAGAGEPPSAEQTKSREEGFRQGLAVGYRQGYEAGEAKALRQGERFREIMGGFEAGIAALDETVARDLLQLSLELARQVVRAHISVHEDAIVPVVREALNSIAAIAEQPRLVMNPEDADVVKRELGEELAELRCRIIHDPSIERGGVRIEDSKFELDALLATRWKRSVAALGLDNEWLD
jgi:flagellar assembly protein FliH